MAKEMENKTENTVKPYRVLSIDGGGMRGLYTIILLDSLAKRFAQTRNVGELDIGKGFDLIVGTSTGGIIATLLMMGIPTHNIIDLYREAGPKVFLDPVPTHVRSGLIPPLWKWVRRNWKNSVNKTDKLREALYAYLDDVTFKEAYAQRGIALCIPAINMASHKSTVFKTPHHPNSKSDGDYKLIDVCIAGISAPILFPIGIIDDPADPDDYKTFVDGGLWANNPVLVGMAEALMMSSAHQRIEIISVSTCDSPTGTFIAKDRADWGIKDWRVGTRILSLSLETQSYAYQEMARILSSHLRQPCKIIRLPQTPPSSEQERYLLMDQATPRSLKVLSDLAKSDAERAYNFSLGHEFPEFSALNDVFTSMPTMSVETQQKYSKKHESPTLAPDTAPTG